MFKIFAAFILCLNIYSKDRIVSTVPSLSEILFTLDLNDKVVGVSKYCIFDKTFCSKDKVGTSLDINYEKIVALNANVVILSNKANSKQVENLKKLKIEVIQIKHDRLEDVYSSIKALSKRFSKLEKSKDIIKKIDESLTRDNFKNKKILFLISSSIKNGKITRVQAAGKGTFYSDILARIGLSNILEHSSMEYPEISREKLITLRFDYVIEIFGDHNIELLKERNTSWKRFLEKRNSKARYLPIVGNFLFLPGPSVWRIGYEIKKNIGTP